MRRYDWFFLLFCLVVLISIGGLWVNPDGVSAEEKSTARTKASFLYYLSKFVVWPEDRLTESDSAITLCILGKDPFGKVLDRMIQTRDRREDFTDKQIPFEHNLIIRRLTQTEPRNDCHILFISASERKMFSAILGGLKDVRVLTVGDHAGFIRSGGMVYLALHRERLRFEINLNLVQAAKLKISSKLLRLATLVTIEASNRE